MPRSGGFGRYDDDPNHIGCPWAKTDMTPCAARDGRLAAQDGVCVGCGVCIADAFAELVRAAYRAGPELTSVSCARCGTPIPLPGVLLCPRCDADVDPATATHLHFGRGVTALPTGCNAEAGNP